MFVWNQSKTGSINLEKVRNFTINLSESGIEIIAWFSDKETISMGRFKTILEAQQFLEAIDK